MEAVTLISGGAGFLGSHLCDRLLQQKKEVICLDNFQTGRRENISHLTENRKFNVLEHNIWEPIKLNVDQIFNLACPASPIAYQRDPVSTIKTAVLGALNMLDLANLAKASIFQASTSEVYGDPNIHPQEESYWGHVNPIGVRACYDEGKRCAETLFFDYRRQYEVDIKVGRIFNTYGPKMQIDDGRVVSNFIVQALTGDDITVYGNGDQTRSFCYVDDLIDGILAFAACGPVSTPVNLGNPHEVSVLELAELICKYTRSNSRITLKPLPMDDPTKRKPDIVKIQKLTGWYPKVTLEDGLKETIKYFQRSIL
tara:strand:- start:2237 stop:3172 length:936 start_codon:yes stop_codon:yes gene_type:complete